MATDRASLKIQEAGSLGSFQTAGVPVTDPVGTVAAAHTDVFSTTKAADDGAAATATTETRTGIYARRLSRCNAVTYVATTGGITADNTNNAVITVSYRDAAGANLTTIGTLTTSITSSGNITQDVGKDFVLAAGAGSIPAGATFTYSIAKAGTGVIVRAGSITLDLEWI